MTPRTSRNLPRPKPRIDKERDSQEAVIEDAGETEDTSRDLVHGDGGTIDPPPSPAISREMTSAPPSVSETSLHEAKAC